LTNSQMFTIYSHIPNRLIELWSPSFYVRNAWLLWRRKVMYCDTLWLWWRRWW
jgi:hypothetical protein